MTLTSREAVLLSRLPLTTAEFVRASGEATIAVNPVVFLARMRDAGYALPLAGTVVRTRAGTAALVADVLDLDLDRAALLALIADYKTDHAEQIADTAYRRKVHLLTYLERKGRL